MATQFLQVDNTPKDIISGLSLENGKYIVQALGGKTVNLVETATGDPEPSIAKGGFKLKPLSAWGIEVIDDIVIYAFTTTEKTTNTIAVGDVC